MGARSVWVKGESVREQVQLNLEPQA